MFMWTRNGIKYIRIYSKMPYSFIPSEEISMNKYYDISISNDDMQRMIRNNLLSQCILHCQGNITVEYLHVCSNDELSDFVKLFRTLEEMYRTE